MNGCIFCKIANKEIESSIFSETENTIAFMDINPVSPGHSLIIPKQHYKDITDTPGQILSEMIIHSKKVALILKQALNASGINILNASGKSAQQTIFHIHFHVIPRFDNDAITLWFHGNSSSVNEQEHIHSHILEFLSRTT